MKVPIVTASSKVVLVAFVISNAFVTTSLLKVAFPDCIIVIEERGFIFPISPPHVIVLPVGIFIDRE